jgi:hypothetical protein
LPSQTGDGDTTDAQETFQYPAATGIGRQFPGDGIELPIIHVHYLPGGRMLRVKEYQHDRCLAS